jgi:hypothetical protein
MNEKTEGALELAAALLVLFTAMLDPIVSAGLAILFLVTLSFYSFARGRRGQHRQ